jgi:inosine/xanthosine triphosphatase
MKTIVVASHNPVKSQAALVGFQAVFPDHEFQLTRVTTDSGVNLQPVGDDETLRGASNRAETARLLQPGADYWVGIEGGIDDQQGQMSAFAWVVILGNRQAGKGRTATFYLPPAVANLVRNGMELGHADDIVFQRDNSKQENGAIGLLSGNAITRSSLYEQAVVMALLPFRNPDLYPQANLLS